MTYRPIGIAPLRNYGWEFIERAHCSRAPSRQVERREEKRAEEMPPTARFYTADPEQSKKKADSPRGGVRDGQARGVAAGRLHSDE